MQLRQRALLELTDKPVVLESHGGFGKIFGPCYGFVTSGVVFEQNSVKAEALSRQRPTWSVYEADCEKALAAGFGAHLPVNFLDLDPYGQPWPALDAFLRSERERPSRLVIAVNDGLRQKLQLNGGWDVASMRPMVEKYGNRLYAIYLDVAKDLMQQKAAEAGYRLCRWTGYYCGANHAMTHYAAVLER